MAKFCAFKLIWRSMNNIRYFRRGINRLVCLKEETLIDGETKLPPFLSLVFIFYLFLRFFQE